jgi:hypothetical protein
MDRRSLPTKDADAFSSFVQGRALFQAYLGSGQGEDLLRARERFASAAARDSEFDIARLYLAVTQTELRDSEAAIPNLKELVQRNRYLPEAHVQLAYAHIKRYKDVDYAAADQELQDAIEAAKGGNREDLIDLIEAYRVFLLAVRGGRGKEEISRKRQYLEEAIGAGQKLLERADREKTSNEKLAILFEARNAVGIAFLWLGELFPSEPRSAFWWKESEQYLRSALDLRPNSVRALQNMGLLRMLHGDRAKEPAEARGLYQEAKEFVLRSLALNSFDQYPHYQMSLLSARTEDWSAAKSFLEAGQNQKGAISAEKWAAIKKAIEDRDKSKILTFR